jgi:CxxC motif-containing protein (DUF1111 family)
MLATATAIAQLAPPRQPTPPVPPTPQAANTAGFGLPLEGLNPTQLAAFNAGRNEFITAENAASGLGPIFNGRSCLECHSSPSIGGASRIVVTRFGRMVDGEFDPLTELGGSLLQRFAINPALQETIPHEANVIAQRQTTPLFGMGLIEAIPDTAIIAGVRANKPDGVKGRALEVIDITTGQRRIGRFGWKAQQATLLAFSADAYLNEMGITNRFFPKENAPNGNEALLAQFKRTPDPEDEIDPATGKSGIDMATDFMRLLAAPARLGLTGNAAVGEALFAQSGCATCHTPSMRTGPNAIAALDRKTVSLYSDLLLHDMGSLGDGIEQAGAGVREMKTPPLWGLRASAPYLHDGRANTLDAAIRAHDGEAAVSRDRYVRMPQGQRQQLQDFLNTL